MKAFSRLYTLQRHSQDIHVKKRHSCNFCTNVYTDASTLRQRVQKWHTRQSGISTITFKPNEGYHGTLTPNKNMILVDPELVDALSHKSVYTPPDTLTDSMGELDQQMQQVLGRGDLTNHDKARLYQRTLQQYLNRLTQYKNRPLGLLENKPDSIPSESIHKDAEPTEKIPGTVAGTPETIQFQHRRVSKRTKSKATDKILTWDKW